MPGQRVFIQQKDGRLAVAYLVTNVLSAASSNFNGTIAANSAPQTVIRGAAPGRIQPPVHVLAPVAPPAGNFRPLQRPVSHSRRIYPLGPAGGPPLPRGPPFPSGLPQRVVDSDGAPVRFVSARAGKQPGVVSQQQGSRQPAAAARINGGGGANGSFNDPLELDDSEDPLAF